MRLGDHRGRPRQPWVVYQLQTTAQAATTNGGVTAGLRLIIAVCAVLCAARPGGEVTWRLGGKRSSFQSVVNANGAM